MLLEFLAVRDATAQSLRGVFDEQAADEILHVVWQTLWDGRMDGKDPPGNLLLVVLLALDRERWGPRKEFVREHADAPPIHRLATYCWSECWTHHVNKSNSNYHIVALASTSDDLRRHVLNGPAKRIRSRILQKSKQS